MANSYIQRGAQEGFGYSEAALYTGMEAVIAVIAVSKTPASNNETILAWYKS